MNDPQANGSTVVYVLIFFLINSGLGVWLVTRATGYLDKRFGVEKVDGGVRVAREAVLAVDQVAKRSGWDPATKLAEAVGRARNIGEAHGLSYTDDQWRTLIEAAVRQVREAAAVVQTPAVVIAPEGTVVAPTTELQSEPAAPAPAPIIDFSDPQLREVLGQIVTNVLTNGLAGGGRAPLPAPTPSYTAAQGETAAPAAPPPPPPTTTAPAP